MLYFLHYIKAAPNRACPVNTIIFLGPTLSIDKVKALLPKAFYHKPVRCGDIFKVMRLKPKRLIMIDGFFGNTASVWHKEILCALESGIEVIGASSMGALRAAELDNYGMIGIGRVYEFYKSHLLTGDDEVAVPHLNEGQCYQGDIFPLVNLRITLEKAVLRGVCHKAQIKEIISTMKTLPFYERSLDFAIGDSSLIDWIKTNYIDQKAIDAIAALNYANKQVVKKQCLLGKAKLSVFVRRLKQDIDLSPFDYPYEWLDEEERELIRLTEAERFFYQDRWKLLHSRLILKESKEFLVKPDYGRLPVSLAEIRSYYLLFRASSIQPTNSTTEKMVDEIVNLIADNLCYCQQLKVHIHPDRVKAYLASAPSFL